jgi:hypothetical protein
LAGLDDLACEVVRVHHSHAARLEQLRAGGFTHPHAAGKSKGFHEPPAA